MATPVGLAIEQRLFGSDEPVVAPHLLDVEVLHVLRKFDPTSQLSASRAQQALDDLGGWPSPATVMSSCASPCGGCGAS